MMSEVASQCIVQAIDTCSLERSSQRLPAVIVQEPVLEALLQMFVVNALM